MDREITIFKAAVLPTKTGWVNLRMPWSKFAKELMHFSVGNESFAEYGAMSSESKALLKRSVGGYVGGEFEGNQRLNHRLLYRDLVTLDCDHLAAGQAGKLVEALDRLEFDYLAHSSQSHTPNAPRMRVIIPLSRSAKPDEYEPLARMIAHKIDPTMTIFDASTYEQARLMYYPRASKDAQRLNVWPGATRALPLADPDQLLAEYPDWTNPDYWWKNPTEGDICRPYLDATRRRSDPLTLSGVVGVFCRTYSIHDAITRFLPDIYEQDSRDENRYTYCKGTTHGGAVVYDEGKFLYSNHESDRAYKRSLNAFELVQTHKFGYLDDGDNDGEGKWKDKKSYEAMRQWLSSTAPELGAFRDTIGRELNLSAEEYVRAAEGTAESDFSDLTEKPLIGADGWIADLTKDGLPKPTQRNVYLILEHHPYIKGKIAHNVFTDRFVTRGSLPWHRGTQRVGSRIAGVRKDDAWTDWTDADSAGLYEFLENEYKFRNKGVTDAALTHFFEAHKINEVTEYLDRLVWDGVPRVDRLLIDYLGAEDTEYVRAVTRKTLVAAVYRAYEPGTKFDQMLVLIGPQGVGKSTLIQRLGRTKWVSDSLESFEGKQMAESIQGKWLIEIAELSAFRRTKDVGAIKQCISSVGDYYRAAYAHFPVERPRRCIFFGTSNEYGFLRDPTGNRRFWPVDVGEQKHDFTVWNDLNESIVDQIWAECRQAYYAKESLLLPEEIEKQARQVQRDHAEEDTWAQMVLEFARQKVPHDWHKWAMQDRYKYWTMPEEERIKAYAPKEREYITVDEVWVECIQNDFFVSANASRAKMTSYDRKRIVDILTGSGEWKRAKKTKWYKAYGASLRGYERV